MCGSSAAAETQDGGRQLEQTASIAAHELGHNLNMAHDDSSTRTRMSWHVCVMIMPHVSLVGVTLGSDIIFFFFVAGSSWYNIF